MLVLHSLLSLRRQRSPANANTRLPLCYISPRVSHKQGFIFCARTALFSAAQHPRSRSGSPPRPTQPDFFFFPFCLFQANPVLLLQQAGGFATWKFRSLWFICISYYSLKKVQRRGKIWVPLSGLGRTLMCRLGGELLLLSALFWRAQAWHLPRGTAAGSGLIARTTSKSNTLCPRSQCPVTAPL